FEVFGNFAAGRAARAHLAFRLTMPGPVNERISRVGTSLRLGSALPTLSWVRGEGWHTSPAVDAFSESVATEVADWDVRVRVPDGFTVLSTGAEVEPGRFVASAVRDWAATIGRLRLAEGTAQDGRTKVVVGVDAATGDDEQARLRTTIETLDAMAARYGPYPWPVLTVGITPSLSGGIEFPQHLQVGLGTPDAHLIHEVAHMWFYALVGNDQYADPWLDEGLTEYAEARHMGTLGSVRSETIPPGGAGQLGEGHDYWAARTGIFFRSVYVQGAQALAALGDVAGGVEGVDCALRRFVLEHANTVADPADFVSSFQAQTGADPRPVLERFGVTE
ncbi:MAG TPA: M1 family aminopeptidase, partial [Acidimicrobiia bacterium]|nr:M1 family aminopeptidase [Acidimicrobiia bacterium]